MHLVLLGVLAKPLALRLSTAALATTLYQSRTRPSARFRVNVSENSELRPVPSFCGGAAVYAVDAP